MTPSRLQEELGVPRGLCSGGGSTGGRDASSLAVAEFDGEQFLETDLRALRRTYGQWPERGTVKVLGPGSATKDPAPAPKGPAGSSQKVTTTARGDLGEGFLDLQVAGTLNPGAPVSWWGVAEFELDGFVLAYFLRLNDHPEPPMVHSISWGDEEAAYHPSLVRRLDY